MRTIWSFTGLATAENVQYYDTGLGAVPTPSELTDVANLFLTAWGSTPPYTGHIMNQLSHDVAITEVDVEDVSSATGPFTHMSENIIGGNGTMDSAPPGVAAVITWYTALRGRSHRGRTFVPGIPAPNIDPSGALVTSEYNNLTTGAAEFITALKSPTGFPSGHLVVASFYSGVDPTTHRPIPRALATVEEVTGSLVRGHVHSQRRRNPRD